MSEFRVDKGIPIPASRCNNGRKRYPFGEMEIGDSFFVPGPAPKTQHRLLSAASHYGKKHEKKFITRRVIEGDVDGVRVFRVADEPATRPRLAAAS